MLTLGLSESTPAAKGPGFWRRQFQQRASRKQRVYDWLFGVVLPAACFYFDPFVFRMWTDDGKGMFSIYVPFVYVLSYVSIMGMIAWLLWGERLRWLNAVLAGLFGAGGLVSLFVGIVLAPFSLIGLIVLVGALGFTPLFTSVIYLRNSARAFRAAGGFLDSGFRMRVFVLSGLLSIVLPYLFNVYFGAWQNPITFLYGGPLR